MKGFNFQPSPNTKVAKRQQHHFERNCHRVLKKEVIKSGGTSNVSSKLVHTVEPFRPLPKFRVLENYQDIVPPDPIYNKKGEFIAPGTIEWFYFMRRRDLNTWEERLQRNKIVEHTPSDGDKFHKSKQEKDAKYHGTSKSEAITNKYASTNKLKIKMDTLLASFPNIFIPKKQSRLSVHTTELQQDSKGKSAVFEDYLSSDTIAIESRSLKRWVDINPNLSILTNTPKRSRQESFI
ncbi:hypothetical protein C1646_768434 [Rhizophagus diaphanus]|nr:hypothetical protein C1646_768434 [Rhizophagus diaphanus] [Rhizophagus sp. MUCL 43196]